MRFRDREDAGRRLADQLERYRDEHPVILGIPRGGLPVARVIADRLRSDLDVMLVRRLRHPAHPDQSIGSVDEFGHVYLTPRAADATISDRALEDERARQVAALRGLRRRFTAARPPLELAGHPVIVVDDGLVTGATAVAAIRSARVRLASDVVVAVPVARPGAVARVRAEADDIVCLFEVPDLTELGAVYDDFREVTDDEAVRLIGAHAAAVRPTGLLMDPTAARRPTGLIKEEGAS